MKKAFVVAALILICCARLAGACEIQRSASAVNAFKRANACPRIEGTTNGKPTGPCPGFVVDHIKPLACGGEDKPSNMQWQSVADAKAKDKWERKGCSRGGPKG